MSEHDEPVYHSPNCGTRRPIPGASRRVPKPITDENDFETLQDTPLVEPFPEGQAHEPELGGDHG